MSKFFLCQKLNFISSLDDLLEVLGRLLGHALLRLLVVRHDGNFYGKRQFVPDGKGALRNILHSTVFLKKKNLNGIPEFVLCFAFQKLSLL